MRTPKLIVVDGMDCTGKSTIVSPYVEEWFKRHDIPALRVADLDYTPFGLDLRPIFLSKQHATTADITSLVMLSCSARRELIQSVIRPALVEGKYVICDRFTSTTYAYGGRADHLKALLELSEDGTSPDHTIFLTLSHDTYLTRMGLKGGSDDQFECTSKEKFEHRLDRYMEYFMKRQHDVTVIDTDKPIDYVHRELDILLKSLT